MLAAGPEWTRLLGGASIALRLAAVQQRLGIRVSWRVDNVRSRSAFDQTATAQYGDLVAHLGEHRGGAIDHDKAAPRRPVDLRKNRDISADPHARLANCLTGATVRDRAVLCRKIKYEIAIAEQNPPGRNFNTVGSGTHKNVAEQGFTGLGAAGQAEHLAAVDMQRDLVEEPMAAGVDKSERMNVEQRHPR